MKRTTLGLLIALLISMGCSPSAPTPNKTPATTTQRQVQKISTPPNVALTITYDTSEDLPRADELTILIDDRIIDAEATGNIFKLHLEPGTYDVQISAVNRSAARGSLTVSENANVEQSFNLKTEAWGLLGDKFDIKLIGLRENRVVDVKTGLRFGVYNEAGTLLPFDHISIVIVGQIETGSFRENAGGLPDGRTTLIQDKFSIEGVTAKIADTAELTALLNSLEPGDYVIEIDIWDSVNDKLYHDVDLFRVAETSQTQDGQ